VAEEPESDTRVAMSSGGEEKFEVAPAAGPLPAQGEGGGTGPAQGLTVPPPSTTPSDPPTSSAPPSPPLGPAGWARFVRDRWLSIDLRTLGLFRIAFGLCLIANLLDHWAGGNLARFFSNEGVLTNHYALYAPIQQRVWSLLFAFSRPGEVAVAFSLILAVYVLYTIGWRTRLMQILTLVCFISLLNRNLLLQDGGSFTCSVLAVWTTFLPLGARFSVDAWRAVRLAAVQKTSGGEDGGGSTGRATSGGAPAMHVSFVCLALLLQLAAIYGLNAANKTGPTWTGGTAVHYIFWLNSRNTWLAGLMRAHEPAWLSPLLTRGTLVFEWSAPFLALSPVFQTPLRRVLIASMWCFHLGIASLMSLGPFAYAMMAFSLLLLGPNDWRVLEPRGRRALSWLARRMAPAVGIARRLGPLVEVGLLPVAGLVARLPADVGASLRRSALVLREGAAVSLAVLMLVELTLANGAIPPALQLKGRPQWMGEILYYLRIYQTWSMFAPEVPREDGVIVVDAVLSDGSHLDPFTGRPPDFQRPLGGPCRYDHDWSEYTYYFPWDRHRAYRIGLRDHIVEVAATWPPEHPRLRSFEVFWVSADLPPPGERDARNLRRESLIAWDGR